MILVTGGAGYIGSHTVVELLANGHEVLVVDNHSNSKPSVIERIHQITGKKPHYVSADIRDRAAMRGLFAQYTISAVIHFAGLKAVGESVTQPLRYYDNNVVGSLVLFECMAEAGVKTLVFSSSATVYGDPCNVPVCEDAPLSATNPYGRSKLMVEEILQDIAHSDSTWRIALLRYFNPVGAHASGMIGEDPAGIPNNLMPYVAQVAVGRLKELSVYGNDYSTPDGTGVRDYIHVVDLATGHLAALIALANLSQAERPIVVNLGTGRGYSVLEMVAAFERVSNRRVPYRIVARRPGDVAQCYADPGRARELMAWSAQYDIDDMCRDTWRWQQWAAEHME